MLFHCAIKKSADSTLMKINIFGPMQCQVHAAVAVLCSENLTTFSQIDAVKN